MDTQSTPSSLTYPTHFEIAQTAPGLIKVIRRNGTVTPFDATKIAVAMTKAFLAVEGDTAAGSSRIHEKVAAMTKKIADTFSRRLHGSGTIHIEEIQDQVELELMRTGEYKVAKGYVLYREERRKIREQQQQEAEIKKAEFVLHVTLSDGSIEPLDMAKLQTQIENACAGLSNVNPNLIIEKEPNYTYVAARLLQDDLRREAFGFLKLPTNVSVNEMKQSYASYLEAYLKKGIELELLDPRLIKNFDLRMISAAIKPERDLQFTYLGLQTLYDRYFIHSEGTRFELPQAFFMRVAMGLAIEEKNKEARAIEFYHLLSSFDFMSSTPTLFNSGTLRPQLSSCYLTTVPDDLDGI